MGRRKVKMWIEEKVKHLLDKPLLSLTYRANSLSLSLSLSLYTLHFLPAHLPTDFKTHLKKCVY